MDKNGPARLIIPGQVAVQFSVFDRKDVFNRQDQIRPVRCSFFQGKGLSQIRTQPRISVPNLWDQELLVLDRFNRKFHPP